MHADEDENVQTRCDVACLIGAGSADDLKVGVATQDHPSYLESGALCGVVAPSIELNVSAGKIFKPDNEEAGPSAVGNECSRRQRERCEI